MHDASEAHAHKCLQLEVFAATTKLNANKAFTYAQESNKL